MSNTNKGPAKTTPPATPGATASGGNPPPVSVITNQRNAPPMKKRAKGSGFLSMLFLSAFVGAGYFVWSSLFQYKAMGVIEGRVIAVAAPWDGTVARWLVREGDLVVQGETLAQVSNLQMEHELQTLGDELKMSQAKLEAEMSKIRFEVQDYSDRSQQAVAEYLKLHGELLAEKSKLQELDRKFSRTKRLAKTSNVSRSEYERIFFQLTGQRNKVEKLEDAVEVLKSRSEDESLTGDDGASRLKPILAQIDVTQSKIYRLRERINQGDIKSPVTGRVSKKYRLTGESARFGETVIDVLEDNSVEAVLYVPQKIIDEFVVGNELRIVIEPYDDAVICTVDRFGDRFGPAPKSIERFYKINQPLLPVYLTPNRSAADEMSTRLGGTVKRPYEYGSAIEKMAGSAKQFIAELIGGSETNQRQRIQAQPAGWQKTIQPEHDALQQPDIFSKRAF